MEFHGLFGVEGKRELVVPAEVEAGAGKGIVAELCREVSLGDVRRVGSELVGDHAVAHVVAVGQAQVFLGRHVAEHGGAVPADLCRTDGRRDVVVTGSDVGGEGAERVERRSVALLELACHVVLDLVHGHMARAFDNHLHAVFPGDLREFAESVEFAELGGIVRVGERTRAKPVAERYGDVVCREDLADFTEMRVEEVLLVVRHLPEREDGSSAANDAGGTLGRERDVFHQEARVNREVVHALFRLLDERVAEDFPGEVLRPAVHLLERLVDRHCSYRHGAVADNPFAGLVDVLAGGKVHHRVGAPAYGPGHLLDFFLDGTCNGRVADVAVDFHQEVRADDHGLAFRVVDVARQNRAACGNLVADEFRRDGLAVAFELPGGDKFVDALVLADGDVFHFLGDDSLAGVVQLGQVMTGLCAERMVRRVEAQVVELVVLAAGASVGRRDVVELLGVTAFHNPAFPEAFDTLRHVKRDVLVAIGAARVVHGDGRELGVVNLDFTHSHADVRINLSRYIHLAGVHKWFKERLHQILAFPTETL